MPKVLLIDDSAFMRKMLRGFLEEAGYDVVDFLPGSALEVLEKLRECTPDLVLTDFNMPDVDGASVIRMARRHAATLPIVLLTASRDAERDARLLEQQPLWVLYKPIKGEELVEAMARILPPGPASA